MARLGGVFGRPGCVLVASWGRLGPFGGRLERIYKNAQKPWENAHFPGSEGRLGGVLGHLGASWGRLGASWGRLGRVLGRLGSSWGRLGDVLRESGACPGGVWADPGEPPGRPASGERGGGPMDQRAGDSVFGPFRGPNRAKTQYCRSKMRLRKIVFFWGPLINRF